MKIVITDKAEDLDRYDIAIVANKEQCKEIVEKLRDKAKITVAPSDCADYNVDYGMIEELIKLLSKPDMLNLVPRLTPPPLVVHDEEKVLFANVTFLETLGLKEEDAAGKPIENFIGQHTGLVRERAKKLMKGEKVTPVVIPVTLPNDEKVWLEVDSKLVDFGGRKAVLSVLRNVTDMVYREELEKANRMLRMIVDVNRILLSSEKEEAIEGIEELLSEYSFKVGEGKKITVDGETIKISIDEDVTEFERELIETLARDLAHRLKALKDRKKKEEAVERLVENVIDLMTVVDGIRNPLAALSGYIEIYVEDEETKEKMMEQIEKIVELIKNLDMLWRLSEEVVGRVDHIGGGEAMRDRLRRRKNT